MGLKVIELDKAGGIDITVDGADEIGPDLALIKGGGAASTREVVWEASLRWVTIADAAKASEDPGPRPLPIRSCSFGHTTTAGRIAEALGLVRHSPRRAQAAPGQGRLRRSRPSNGT